MIERVQYNAVLGIIIAIKETSQLKFTTLINFESLKFKRWFRNLWFLYKLRSIQTPSVFIHLAVVFILICLNGKFQ